MSIREIAEQIIGRMTREKWIYLVENGSTPSVEIVIDDCYDDPTQITIGMVNFNGSTVLLIGGNGYYTKSISCNVCYPSVVTLCDVLNQVWGELSGYTPYVDVYYA